MAERWFLAVEGVTGDSTAEGHENELDIDAWSWGLQANERSGGGGAVGRPVLEDLVVSLASDPGALQLIRVCAGGRPAETATLTGVRGGEEASTFLRYRMQRVSVTSVAQATAEDGSVLHRVALRFRGLTAIHTAQAPDGGAGAVTQVVVGNITD